MAREIPRRLRPIAISSLQCTLLMGFSVMPFLIGTGSANTVTGLSVEDISVVPAVLVFDGNFTIVEWDPYEDGGDAGNTVNTTSEGFFSHTSQGVDGLFWRRTNQGIPASWTGLGGSNHRYRGESVGPTDNLLAQNTTSITDLDASKAYKFFYLAGGRQFDIRNYTADFGAVATTERSAALNLLHLAGLGENPDDPNGQLQLGFYAVPIGTTSGSTSVQVSLQSTDGAYWIGVGYVELDSPPPPAVTLTSVDHSSGSREAIVSWNSSEGVSYTVEASNDLASWEILENQVLGEAGDVTSYLEDFDTSGLPVNVLERYYRVTTNP